MARTHLRISRASMRMPRVRHPHHSARPSDNAPGTEPSLDRSRPLPGGRSVVGALLITVAAVGVFAAYRSASAGPTSPVVVTSGDLPAGHRVVASDLRIERAELPTASAAQVFDSISGLEGSVTLAPMRAGELVQRSAVLARGAEQQPRREFSFAVDRERAVNGELQRGEQVDVLATFGTGDGAYTSVVAREVTLITVDGAKSNGIGSVGKLTITVSMANPDDVLKLAHATQVAPITLVRATRSEAGDPGTLDTYRAPSGKVDSKGPAGTATPSSSTPSPSGSTGSTGSPTPSSSTTSARGS